MFQNVEEVDFGPTISVAELEVVLIMTSSHRLTHIFGNGLRGYKQAAVSRSLVSTLISKDSKDSSLLVLRSTSDYDWRGFIFAGGFDFFLRVTKSLSSANAIG